MEFLAQAVGVAVVILAFAGALYLIIKVISTIPHIRIPRPRIRKSKFSPPWGWSSYKKTIYQSKTDKGKVKISISNGMVDYKDSSGRKFKGPMDDAPDYVQEAIKSVKKNNKKVEDDFNGMFDDFNDMFKDDDFFEEDDD